jgi:hypothetical protein
MFQDIGSNVELSDIDRSHRIGKPNSTKPRPIIVKFTSYRTRSTVFKNRSKLKLNGYRDIYVNEDLTKNRSNILFKARMLVKAKKLESAWSSDGTILIKVNEGSIKRIQHSSELDCFQ